MVTLWKGRVKRAILEKMDPTFSRLNRYEDKFIVKRDEAAKIQREVEKHLKPYFVEPGVKFEFIKSTYFDSDKLTFYRNHLDDKYPRVKMRIRQYAPNGAWDPDNVFLELKEKDDKGESTKTRIQLDTANHQRLLSGKKVEYTPELKKLNSFQTPQRLHSFMKRVNDYVTRLRLKPVVSVMYKRLAYQNAQVRVTIDYNIIYRSEGTLNLMKIFSIINSIDWDIAKKYSNKYDTQKDAVIEVKYETAKEEEGSPDWIKDLIKDYKMEQTRFSKYMWAAFRLISKILG